MTTHLESGTSVPMHVAARETLADGIYELTLTHQGFHFEAGECVVLFGPDGVSRPYSVASSPAETGQLRILYRKMPNGLLTTWLCERDIGDDITVSYPFGDFRPDPGAAIDGQGPVFVATGVGIAPFLSALRDMQSHAPKPLCVYGVRTQADVVDLDLLSEQCELTLAVSRETVPGHVHGYVNGVVQALDVRPPRHYYLCGLDAMVYDVSDWLEEQGVPADHVHTEVFFTAT